MHFLPSVSPNAEIHWQELLSKAMADYDLIDEFFYNLTNEDFSGKYALFFTKSQFRFTDQAMIA